jgi:transposase-like protein
VANKRGPERKGPGFWSEAIKRINAGENVTALAQELGVSARRLYRWRAKLEPGEGPAAAAGGKAGAGGQATEAGTGG